MRCRISISASRMGEVAKVREYMGIPTLMFLREGD